MLCKGSAVKFMLLTYTRLYTVRTGPMFALVLKNCPCFCLYRSCTQTASCWHEIDEGRRGEEVAGYPHSAEFSYQIQEA